MSVCEKTDTNQAIELQIKYCNEHGMPFFVPNDGRCYRCNNNIFTPIYSGRRTNGISCEQAANSLITSCPHCNYSFAD